jgi:membrane protein required for colicin V production
VELKDMEVYDLIMLLVLASATLFGAWKGLAWQVASLGSIFASYFVAYHLRGPVANMINASPPWDGFLAMMIIFLVCSLAIWIAFRLVSDMIDRVKLREFDRHTGAVLGLLRGCLWCVIITLFAVTLLGETQRQKIIDSRSGHYIALLLDKSHAVMPAEVHDVLAPYIHSLDDRLGEDHEFSHHHDTADLNPFSGSRESDDHGFSPASILQDTFNSSSDESDAAVQRWMEKMPELGFGERDH